MVVAIVAFLGTILGALIAAATNYFVAVRRERAEEERERQKRAIELRRASRLIQSEFEYATAAMTKALQEKEWWPDLVNISHEAWEKYAETIAAEVPDETWKQLLYAREATKLLSNIRNQAQGKQVNLFSIPEVVEGYTHLAKDIKTGSDALNRFSYPDSYPAAKREERVTMKTSLWIIGLFATLLQLTGLLCGSYGVLRESFANLAQPRGYGEGRFGEGTFGGTPTRVEEALITLGTKTRLLPSDKNLTLTDRKTNAAWAIAGVLLAFLGTIIDFAAKIISR